MGREVPDHLEGREGALAHRRGSVGETPCLDHSLISSGRGPFLPSKGSPSATPNPGFLPVPQAQADELAAQGLMAMPVPPALPGASRGWQGGCKRQGGSPVPAAPDSLFLRGTPGPPLRPGGLFQGSVGGTPLLSRPHWVLRLGAVAAPQSTGQHWTQSKRAGAAPGARTAQAFGQPGGGTWGRGVGGKVRTGRGPREGVAPQAVLKAQLPRDRVGEMLK